MVRFMRDECRSITNDTRLGCDDQKAFNRLVLEITDSKSRGKAVWTDLGAENLPFKYETSVVWQSAVPLRFRTIWPKYAARTNSLKKALSWASYI